MSAQRKIWQAAVIALATAASLLTAAEPSAASPSGTFRIVNRQMPGWCLQANPVTAPQDHTSVHMAPCDNSSVYQRWIFTSAAGIAPGYSTVQNGAGGCLDLHDDGGAIHRGDPVQIYRCGSSDGRPNRWQMWRFAEPVNQSYSTACVHAAILCDLVLDQQLFSSPDVGYRVYIWNYHGGPNQMWRLEFRN